MAVKRNTYRCWSCGELLRSWAAAERHVDAQRRQVHSGHGGRIEIVNTKRGNR